LEKENTYLNLYLGALKTPWINHCKELNQKPGSVLKRFVQDQLKESVKPLKQTRESPDDAIKQRFTVLLTPSEKAALEICAKRDQCSQRRWVINAIRAGLTKQPQFGMKEIKVLGNSNYQLLAVGRNINQIAKALNEGGESHNISELILDLRKVIKVHVKAVSNVLRASVGRWDIE